MPIVVSKGKTGSKEDVIGTFRRLTMEEGIVDELRERVSHKKPSEKRYARLKVAIWRKKCRRRSKKSRIINER
jgi:ribosomal protein S21